MAELAICDRWGIGHSAFLALPEEDQDLALAFAELKTNTCPGCGTEPEEWDPAVGGSLTAWVGDVVRCRGCEALAQEQQNLSEEAKEAGPEAVAGARPVLVRPPVDAEAADD